MPIARDWRLLSFITLASLLLISDIIITACYQISDALPFSQLRVDDEEYYWILIMEHFAVINFSIFVSLMSALLIIL